MASQAQREQTRRPAATVPPPEAVDPVWLLKAFGVMLLLALLCTYITLCGLFYRGQWQLVLHPSRSSVPPPTVGGLPFDVVRFGAEATGLPQLTGWWIPAPAAASSSPLTILFLPGGDGSLADDQGTLAALHDLGAAVFAIDYRGYGQSAALHPSEQTMTEDAESAWGYLTGSRALHADTILLYGHGLGASLALHLAATQGAAPAVILDSPDFKVEQRVRMDPRTRLVPLGLLFHDRFALLPALSEVRTPKLILTRGVEEDAAVLKAANPKVTAALPPRTSAAQDIEIIRRFLDQYALPLAPPTAAPALGPTPAP